VINLLQNKQLLRSDPNAPRSGALRPESGSRRAALSVIVQLTRIGSAPGEV